jgi:hypothetical protein
VETFKKQWKLSRNGGNFESFHGVGENYRDSVESNPGRTKLTKNIQREDRQIHKFLAFTRETRYLKI